LKNYIKGAVDEIQCSTLPLMLELTNLNKFKNKWN